MSNESLSIYASLSEAGFGTLGAPIVFPLHMDQIRGLIPSEPRAVLAGGRPPLGYRNPLFHIFDSVGLVALESHIDALVHEIRFILRRNTEQSYCPRCEYNGELRLKGVLVDSNWAEEDVLKNLPFLEGFLPGNFRARLGGCYLSVTTRSARRRRVRSDRKANAPFEITIGEDG